MNITKRLLTLQAVFFLLVGCHGNSDPVVDGIPGTYTRAIRGPFANGNDTLVIRVLSEQAANYQVTRSATLVPVDGKSTRSPRRLFRQWVATYNEKTRQLETGAGDLVSFVPEKNAARLGNLEFIKTK